MCTVNEIMNEALTLEEVNSKIHSIETLLPNSEGKTKVLRLAELEQLRIKQEILSNPLPENNIIISSEDEKIDSDNNCYKDKFNRFNDKYELATPSEKYISLGLQGVY